MKSGAPQAGPPGTPGAVNGHCKVSDPRACGGSSWRPTRGAGCPPPSTPSTWSPCPCPPRPERSDGPEAWWHRRELSWPGSSFRRGCRDGRRAAGGTPLGSHAPGGGPWLWTWATSKGPCGRERRVWRSVRGATPAGTGQRVNCPSRRAGSRERSVCEHCGICGAAACGRGGGWLRRDGALGTGRRVGREAGVPPAGSGRSSDLPEGTRRQTATSQGGIG